MSDRPASKAAWLKAIRARVMIDLKPLDLFVAQALPRWAIGDDFSGFRSQEDLAADCNNCSERYVRASIARLRKAGFLDVKPGSGRGIATTFRLTIPVGEKVEQTRPLSPSEKGGTEKREKVEQTRSKRWNEFVPHLKRESKNRSRESPLISPLTEDFEKFWQQYPRKKARAQALKAYERVIKRGAATAEQLLQAAMRFAAERDGEEPRYTKHAATWLNNECWLDEPDRPAQPKQSQPRSAVALLKLISNGGGE